MAQRAAQPALTPEQKAGADRAFTALQQTAADDLRARRPPGYHGRLERLWRHRVHGPRHRPVGLTEADLSRGATAAGARGRLAEAATQVLPELSGRRVSEAAAVRATERVGEDVGQRSRSGRTLGGAPPRQWSDGAGGRAVGHATRCHRLEHEGGDVVLGERKGGDVPARSAAVRDAHRVLLVCFGSPAHRMDYPSHRARGWLDRLGSGRGLVVNRSVIARNVRELLPYMQTENLMMAAVRAGEDRQEVHEVVRQHSHAVTARVKSGEGSTAELLTRLQNEGAFKNVDFASIAGAQAKEFVGRAPEQVDEFIGEHVAPIRARYANVLGKTAELHV